VIEGDSPSVTFIFPEPIAVTGLKIVNAFKTMTKEWLFLGSDNGRDWTTIQELSDPETIEPFGSVAAAFDAPSKPFRQFRFESTQRRGSDKKMLIIAGFDLFDDPECSASVFARAHSQSKYVAATTSAHSLHSLLSPRAKTVWFSSNEPGQWVIFHFPEHAIIPVNYTLRSGEYWHMASWDLDASENGKRWFSIDRRRQAAPAIRPFAVSTWRCRTNHVCRFVRLKLVGQTYDRMSILCLSGFELFGAIRQLTEPHAMGATVDLTADGTVEIDDEAPVRGEPPVTPQKGTKAERSGQERTKGAAGAVKAATQPIASAEAAGAPGAPPKPPAQAGSSGVSAPKPPLAPKNAPSAKPTVVSAPPAKQKADPPPPVPPVAAVQSAPSAKPTAVSAPPAKQKADPPPPAPPVAAVQSAPSAKPTAVSAPPAKQKTDPPPPAPPVAATPPDSASPEPAPPVAEPSGGPAAPPEPTPASSEVVASPAKPDDAHSSGGSVINEDPNLTTVIIAPPRKSDSLKNTGETTIDDDFVDIASASSVVSDVAVTEDGDLKVEMVSSSDPDVF
jgi:hypothetical protein